MFTVAFTVHRFCVQAFRRRAGVLMPDETGEFYAEGPARRAMDAAARRADGVALYMVKGEPVTALWHRPRLLDRRGEVLDLD